jgi:uncharacterized protein (DUF697 family)
MYGPGWPSAPGDSVANVSVKKILSVLADVRTSASGDVRVCLVGRGEALARLAAELSVGAADARDGVSDSVDALEPVDFPAEPGMAGRWRVVAFIWDESIAATDLLPAVGVVRAAGAHAIAVLPWAAGEAREQSARWAREIGIERGDVTWDGRPGSKQSAAVARIVTALGDDALSLAQTLPAVRREVVARLIESTARQNCVIGAVFFIRGADMPAMTLNQVRMVLGIAAAHGEDMGFDRALEILSVVGAGFGLRVAGREAQDLAPGPKWAVKGAIGYAGTVALGKAAEAYFQAGAPLTPERIRRISGTVERFGKGFAT